MAACKFYGRKTENYKVCQFLSPGILSQSENDVLSFGFNGEEMCGWRDQLFATKALNCFFSCQCLVVCFGLSFELLLFQKVFHAARQTIAQIVCSCDLEIFIEISGQERYFLYRDVSVRCYYKIISEI